MAGEGLFEQGSAESEGTQQVSCAKALWWPVPDLKRVGAVEVSEEVEGAGRAGFLRM